MIIALIITFIALQVGQWMYSKKCINNYKLIAQEWRESAEALKDEITNHKIRLRMDETPTGVLSELEASNKTNSKN